MSAESASASASTNNGSITKVSCEQLLELLRAECVAPPILKAMEKCQYGGPEFCDPDFLADAFSDDVKKECGVTPLHLRAFERIRAELLLQQQHVTTAKEAQGASSPGSAAPAAISSDALNAVRCSECGSIIPEEFVWKFFDPVAGKIVGWNCCCSVSFSAPFWEGFSHLPDIPRECNAIAVVELLSDVVEFLNNNKHITKVCVGSGGMGELERCRFVTAVSFGTPERDFKRKISHIGGRLQELYVSTLCERFVTDDDLAAIAQHCSASLRGLRCCWQEEISDAGLIRVIAACKGLRLLEITRCSGITNGSIQALALNCKNVCILKFHCACKVTESDLLALVANCKELQVLDLGYSENSETGAHIVAESCKNLQSLTLGSMTDAALATLAKNCKGLLHLHVRGAKITDIAVQALSVNCMNLLSLDLRGCPLITDVAVQSLAQHCKRLRNVDLNWSKITDASLQSLSRNCTDLRSLGLYECRLVSDAGVHAVASNCKFLYEIDLSHTNISDAAVEHLVNNCNELRNLHLIGCSITDAAMHAVAAANPKHLRSLHVTRCDQVSDDAVAVLKAKCKDLHFTAGDTATMSAIAFTWSSTTKCSMCACEIPDELVWHVFDPKTGKVSANVCCCGCELNPACSRTTISFGHDSVASAIPLDCNAVAVEELTPSCVDFLNRNKHIAKVYIVRGGMGDIERCRFVTAVYFEKREVNFRSKLCQIGGRLHEMHIGNCFDRWMTDDDLAAVAEHCGDSLYYFGCHFQHVSDASLQRILSACKRLQVLDLSFSKGLTSVWIQQVLSVYCSQNTDLRILNFRDCVELRLFEADVQALTAKRPGLQVLRSRGWGRSTSCSRRPTAQPASAPAASSSSTSSSPPSSTWPSTQSNTAGAAGGAKPSHNNQSSDAPGWSGWPAPRQGGTWSPNTGSTPQQQQPQPLPQQGGGWSQNQQGGGQQQGDDANRQQQHSVGGWNQNQSNQSNQPLQANGWGGYPEDQHAGLGRRTHHRPERPRRYQ